jgi:hypothetical protein
MTVRSQRLLSYTSSAAGQSANFVCPAGYITLVKYAAFWNIGGASTEVLLETTTASGADTIRVFDQVLANNANAQWSGWVALNPGDYFYVSAGASGVRAWVSGAILAGPNQFAPVE